MNFATITDLQPHQREAFAKQVRSRVGALFMDMGTGKSRTAIELAHYRANRVRNVVWFCPVSLKETIRHEICKHTDARPEDICVFDDKVNQRSVDMNCDWYVVGIESMSSSVRLKFAANSIISERSMVIVDESSYIKGHRSARTNWITQISHRARYRLILTGTPITQGVQDLYAQMRFLSPKILGYSSFYSFSNNHLEYSEKYPGMIVSAHHTEWLAAKIQPYVYQVTRQECMELPQRLYETRVCRLTDDQHCEYENAKYRILDMIDEDGELNSYAIFQLFTELQQIASGFVRCKENGQLIDKELDHHRLDILAQVALECDPEAKIIVWAKYRHDIKAIRKTLAGTFGNDCCEQYYGDINERDRAEAVARWQDPQGARFLVATQSTGSHGLNLTEANYVIFYNNGFKYSDRIQAEARIHRYGQEKQVTYIDVTTDAGIDKRIHDALEKKGDTLKDFREEVDKIKDKGKLRKVVESL